MSFGTLIFSLLVLPALVFGSCCPSGAWGELKNTDYEAIGVIEQANDLEIYRVGNGTKCIIWNYDIFGFDSGRTRQMADFLAAHGYLVLIPDYYRRTFIDPSKSEREDVLNFIKSTSDWNNLLAHDWTTVKSFAKRMGAETFGTIGTCWGSYVVIRLSQDVDIKAGVSMHPSHPNIAKILEEDEEELLKNVKCPQLFMPSRSDSPSTKFNGLGKSVLGDALEIVEFPDMNHGWTVRGDLNDPKVERDVRKAFNLALSFFKKYL